MNDLARVLQMLKREYEDFLNLVRAFFTITPKFFKVSLFSSTLVYTIVDYETVLVVLMLVLLV